jgi:tRNA-dihydrouridine synthase
VNLTLGSLQVATPVVLAPMAGITNAAYRRLCLEQMIAQGGDGLFVCEMITSRGLVEGDDTTRRMLVFDEAEQVRSVQLYGTDPVYVGKAVELLCSEFGVAHVDLNFGCPVPKVTRKGGGGALPWKRGLLSAILADAFAGRDTQTLPPLGEVAAMMRRHAELLSEHMGEKRGCKEFRKHVSWYLKGFRAGGHLRHCLALIDSLAMLEQLLSELDPTEPFPVAELGAPRGRQGSPRARVALPEGWLDDTDGSGVCVHEETSEITGG